MSASRTPLDVPPGPDAQHCPARGHGAGAASFPQQRLWVVDQLEGGRSSAYNQILLDLKGRGKAVVVISHDDRYFHLADRVIHLESGQLVSDKATGGKAAPGALSA